MNCLYTELQYAKQDDAKKKKNGQKGKEKNVRILRQQIIHERNTPNKPI